MRRHELLIRICAFGIVAGPLLLSCGGGEEGPTPEEQAEFLRHLRQGVEQLRRYLPDSARAEFDKCAKINPRDSELLFHQARLTLFPSDTPSDLRTAAGLLRKSLEIDPKSVKALRLLSEVERMGGGFQLSASHQAAYAEIYGPVGRLEADSHEAYLREERPPYLRLQPGPPEGAGADDYRAVVDVFERLERSGRYAPSKAIPVMEEILRKYPDLVVIRMEYLKILIFLEVRVNYTTRPDLLPMSSKLVLDMVQSHLERTFDQLSPGSSMASHVIFLLSHTGLLMADYDEAVTQTDILLERANLPAGQRTTHIGRKGLLRYKQGRHGEALKLFREALQGLPAGSLEALTLLWVMHLAHEGAGTEPSLRAPTFPFRKGLALAGDETPLLFEDIAPRLRINKFDGLGPSAWADYDHDGDFDLFVCGCDSYGALYRNDGEVFTDVSREAGIFHVQSGYSSTFADYDNDGWPDIYIGRDGWNGPYPNSLYRNNGDGTFTEVTERAGVGHPGSSFVHAWSDIDRDGDLDLYVANGITGSGDLNVLYRNNGDGTFTDATEEAGLLEPKGTKTIGVAVGDYDGDGWPDIFVSGHKRLNRLYHNLGDGTFEEVAEKAGVGGEDCISRGYVCFFLDYNNDLRPDILRTSLAPWHEVLVGLSKSPDAVPAHLRESMLRNSPKLYRNNGDGTFTDVSVEAGLVHPVGTMGAGVADLDNDGFVDLYFGTGDPAIERMEPDRFYRNNGNGTFTDLTFAAGLGNVGKGHGVTFMDWDGDGVLEIYAPEGGFVHGDQWPNAFYRNTKKTGNHWLHVDLEGVKSNRGALDARLVVTCGKLRVLREVHNGEGFGSSNSPTVEFGLGKAEKIDRLEIRWPGGTVQSFDDVPIDRRIFVKEGAKWSTERR